jgi:hypothetical protein
VSGRMAGMRALARAALALAAAVVLVHRRPGPALGLFLVDSALFIGLGDVPRLAVLLLRVFRFVAARHDAT